MSAANDGDAIAAASRPAQAARMKRFIGNFLIVRFRANAVNRRRTLYLVDDSNCDLYATKNVNY